MENFTAETLARAFAEHRERLKHLAGRNLNPVLLKRLSPEDVLQSAYEAAAKRLNYFAAAPEVPVYFKLRTILFQTITDLERHHLQAQGRDAYKEVEVEGQGRGGDEDGDREDPMEFPADITSPVSRVDREERHVLLRKALSALAPFGAAACAGRIPRATLHDRLAAVDGRGPFPHVAPEVRTAAGAEHLPVDSSAASRS